MAKKKAAGVKLTPEQRHAPIPQSCIISNQYYDLKHGGKAGRRARKNEDRKLCREWQ